MNTRSSGLRALTTVVVFGFAGAASAAPLPPASTNLVLNGSFETTTLSNKGSFQNNVANWTGGANLTYLDYPGTADNGTYLSVYGPFPVTSKDGGNFVEADGDPKYSSAISQTISGLQVGQSYDLRFEQAAGQQQGFSGATTERWQVSFGPGPSQLSTKFSLPQGGVGPWQNQSMTFIASLTTQVLSFLAVGTPGGAPPISFLDGVSLTIPEPASMALLGAGLAGVGFIRMRRQVPQA